MYKLKKIVGSNNFSAYFIKIISHYNKIGYNINVLQQTACLVVNLITVDNCYVLDTQLNKVGSSSELIYFYKKQNIIRGNYDKHGVLLY